MLSWIVFIFSTVLVGLWTLDSFLRGKKSENGCGLPPGPKGVPILGHLHLLGNLAHQDLARMAQKYGPIMHIRLGVAPTVVVSSPEAAELFLKTHDLVFASRPLMESVRNLNYGEKDIVFAQYGPHWRNMRKVCTLELLSATKIESMKAMRKEDFESFVWRMKDASEARAAVDLSENVGSVIEDMTYSMLFGRKFDALDFKPSAHEILRLLGAFNLADYVPFVGKLDLQGIQREMKEVLKVVDQMLEGIIDEHARDAKARQSDQHKDFIDVMLSLTESNSEYQLERDSMKTIIVDMIVAAIDTSSITIEWALSELFRKPEIMKRVQAEVEDVVGVNRLVEEADLSKLHYLDMVVKESMRLHPVGALLVPHYAREDIVVNGYFIPKDTRVLINAWAIGRDQSGWSIDVNEYNPERFSDSKADFRGQDFRFLPFGSGRRGCPGMQLGITTVKMIIAELVHCFNWELPDGKAPAELDMSEKPGLSTPRLNALRAIPIYRLKL